MRHEFTRKIGADSCRLEAQLRTVGFCVGLCLVVAGCAGEKPKKAAGGGSFAPVDSRPAAAALTGVPIKNDLNPELLQPGKAAFTLGPGDAIEVEIIGHPASRALTVVGLDGK